MAEDKFDWSKIPNPIIFGPKQPQLRLMMVGGAQKIYSLSNFNLYLDAYPAPKAWKKVTFTISDLLHFRVGFLDPPVREEFRLPSCMRCNEVSPCRMMVKSVDTYEEGALKLARINLRERVQIDECPVFKRLFDCMQTEQEKKFARVYYAWALGEWDVCRGRFRGTEVVQRFTDRWCEKQTELRPYNRSPNRVTEMITRHFTAPALLPQVWLKYTFDQDANAGEKEGPYDDVPSRVDFLFITDGQRGIIEIDGPSHYATFDKQTRRYEVDEELYARNPRIQRSLAFDGWHVHRFGNWEIANGSELDILYSLNVAWDLLMLGYDPLEAEFEDADSLLEEMEKEARWR